MNNDTVRGEPVLKINPVLGVRHERIASLVARLHRSDVGDNSTPAICKPLGYLMPERRFLMWHYGQGIDNEAIADDMVSAIERYGLPFVRANRTLEELCETMRDWHYAFSHWAAFCLPLGLTLLGRNEEAMENATEWLETREAQSGQEDAEYRAFLGRLKAYVREQDSATM